MTMQPVRISGRRQGNSRVLETITKALREDPAGGAMLAELTVYEAMCDLLEQNGPRLRSDIAKAAVHARSSLVRDYVAKRLAGEPVDELLDAAEVVSQISKAESVDTRRAATKDQPREHGRWAKRNLDLLAAFTSAQQAANQSGKMQAPSGPNTQAYKNLASTGRALTAFGSATTPGGGPLAAAGATAQLVGELGPQAEKILGSPLRRTAYRYRGTEKTPDANIQATAHALGAAAQYGYFDADGGFKVKRDAPLSDADMLLLNGIAQETQRGGRPDRQAALGPEAQAWLQIQSQIRQGIPNDQVRLNATQDYLASTLVPRIPTLHHAKLSQSAGKMPPSVGYIVDSDGDVVSEAQGVNGDHYLPFDLKNLGALHGGGYVRTRTVGGPTDEDIYTALITGARSMTVVSHSGVFNLQFPPDLRGSRRNSDKARAMVKRYSQLLEEINSGQHMENAFSPETIEKAKEYANRGGGTNYAKQRELFNEYLENQKQRLAFGDDADLESMAAERVASNHSPQGGHGTTNAPEHARQMREASAQLRAEKERLYRLDGHGYEAALKALQQEFPFYLEPPTYTPTDKWLGERGMTREREPGAHDRAADLGYTKRKALVPVAVKRKQDAKDAEQAAVAREQATTPQTASATGSTPPAAPGAAAAPAGGTGAGLMQLAKDGPLRRDLRSEVGDQLYRLKNGAQGEELDIPVGPDGGQITDPSVADKHMKPLPFAVWVAQQYKPEEATDWLLNSATKDQITKVQDGLAEGSQMFPEIDTKALQQQLENVKHVRWAYAKPVNDPALAAGDEPQEFPDIPHDPNDVQATIEWLGANREAAAWAQDFAGLSDGDIASRVREETRHYQIAVDWGHKRESGDAQEQLRPAELNHGSTSANEDADEDAILMAKAGPDHQKYKDLLAMQQGWSALRAVQVASALAGAAPPDLSEVGGASPKVQKRDRSRVAVHRFGSPVHASLSKRLSPAPVSRSPQRPLRAVSTRSR